MENVVAKLPEDFERGRMTRRQLIKSRAPIAAAARAAAVLEEESKGFKSVAVNAPPGTPPPRIEHMACTVEHRKANQVKTELERRGLNPPDTENSFHIKDPNGFDLQIIGKDMNLPSVSRLRSLSVGARFILSI